MARSPTRLLIWISLFGVLIAVATAVALALILDEGGLPVERSARWLHVRVDGRVTEAPGEEPLFSDPTTLPPLSTELAAMLREAAEDDEVSGLFLEIEPLGLGWAQVEELRDAVLAVRAAGKPTVCWGEAFTNKEYFLATACEEVRLARAGILLANGLAVTQLYYADALERFGVHANFEHVGAYKSAIEPLTRNGPSEPAAEATNAMLDSLYATFVQGIADGRGWPVERARALVDAAPMTPFDAEAAGAIDGTAWRDELAEGRVGDDPIRGSAYLGKLRRRWSSGKRGIAVIYAHGTITGGESGSDLFGGSGIGDKTLRRQLGEVRDDDDVVAVVLRVDSPGGSGTASEAIWRELRRTAEVKPVVISMGDYAASGGYYISTGADYIVAEPTTLTGSIGVFGGKVNLRGLYEEIGLRVHSFQRGRMARLLSSTTDFDPEERRHFRRYLGVFYQTFLTRVADARGLSLDEVHAVAQGRVWTGEQAARLGLVDELGGLDVAIRRAAELAGRDEEGLAIWRYPERKSLLERLVEDAMQPPEDDALSAAPELRAALGELAALRRALGPEGVAAMMPARIEVR